MLDCRIKGGLVVDGSGAPGFVADVGIRDGRITDVGSVDEPAARTIDATGLVVAPGFIDIHTHYDGQLMWDPTASPSSLHGVTTVIGGNCGFTIAPLQGDSAEYVLPMLAKVEGIPVESLTQGVSWDWTSFGEWLGRLEGSIAVNAGFLAGHSTIRRAVMGPAAVGGDPDERQMEAMTELLRRCLAEGALGFSSSWANSHSDHTGDPVPSRAARSQELVGLASVVRDFPGTTLEFIPPGSTTVFADADVEILCALSSAADRPINWNTLVVEAARRDEYRAKLRTGAESRSRGARVVALTLPDLAPLRLSFANGMVLDALPGWAGVINLPRDERLAALRLAEVRQQLWAGYQTAEAGPLTRLLDWDRIVIGETFSEAGRDAVGLTGAELARLRGTTPFDAILDLVVEDRLQTGLVAPVAGDDPDSWEQRGEVWRDPNVVLGGSDAGAHLDMIWGFSYCTALLGESVRERQLLSLEEAVRAITGTPAEFYGIRDRGAVRPGAHGDITIFDPDLIGRGSVQMRSDLPGDAERLHQPAVGIHRVLVNGTEILVDGAYTGDTPGAVLRSGQDTYTVHASEPR